MTIAINTEDFTTFVKKATLNLSINSVQLNVTKDKVWSKMTSDDQSAFVFIEKPNTFFDGIQNNDELTLNFYEPRNTIMKHIGLINSPTFNADVKEEYMRVVSNKQSSRLHFCSPIRVTVFDRNMTTDIEFNDSVTIDDEFISTYNKIKKVGNLYGKVYFSVEDGLLFIESTDKSIDISDSVKFNLAESESKDWSLGFDFKNMLNLMALIGSDGGYTMSFLYIEEREGGLLSVKSEDNSESYILMGSM